MEQAKCTALAADEGVEGVVPVPVTDKWAEKQAEKEERSLFEVKYFFLSLSLIFDSFYW
jgi:hypothetical protein